MHDGRPAQDAERLIKALEHLSEAVSIVLPVWDASGAIVDLVVEHVNRGGESTAELALSDAGLLAAYRRVIETGRPEVRSVEFADERDGRRRITGAFEVRMSRFGDGALSIYRDVTEQHLAQAALRESEERYRALMEHAPEAIVVLDVETGRFHQVNENAARLFGRPRSELLTLGPSDVSPPSQPGGRPSSGAAREQIALAVDGGTPTFEWVHRGADGRDIPCEVRLVRLPASDRVLIRGSVTDISERKAAEEALRRAAVERRVAARERALQRVADAALAHLRLDDLLDELLARVAEELGADTAAVLLVEHGDDPRLASHGGGEPAATIEVPLLAGKALLGVLQIGWARERKPGPDEIDLLVLAADRAALAIAHARVYERERDTADTLQHSLLPERMPEIPGIVIAARYRPAGERFQVGGDFYDAFQIADSRWLLVVGDVCGKGPEAATLTALARYTLRAEAMHEPRPAELLGLLNDAILRQRSDGRFCTAVCAMLDLRAEGVAITLASGGHPLPLVLRADGSVQELGRTGTLLGIVADVVLEDVQAELLAGDTLLLYTDGLSEVHAPETILGPDEMATMVAGCAGLEPGELVRRLEREAIDEGEEPRDDLAIVAVRVDGRPPPAIAAGGSTRPDVVELPAAAPRPPAFAATGGDALPEPAGAATAPAEREARAAPPLALWIPPIRDAPSIARHAARRAGRLRGRTLETVELLLTELVTNSIRHAGLGPRDLIAVRIEEQHTRLRCEVGDGGPGPRTRPPARPRLRPGPSGGGLGLFLVEQLADRWGIAHDATGARVWFELER
jgi:PAS domain S-box-containing protein